MEGCVVWGLLGLGVGCRSEIMLSEDKSDVCVLYAAAAYDCEFHALDD